MFCDLYQIWPPAVLMFDASAKLELKGESECSKTPTTKNVWTPSLSIPDTLMLLHACSLFVKHIKSHLLMYIFRSKNIKNPYRRK